MRQLVAEGKAARVIQLRVDAEAQRAHEFARQMRLAAVVKWYEMGWVSQSKAAELAGMKRREFLDKSDMDAVDGADTQ